MSEGESTDMGNTFWQTHFGKNRKTHLGRGLVKPSTEVLLIPRPRYCGLYKPSVEVFKYLDRGLKKIGLSLIQTNGKFNVPCRGVNPAIPST